MKVERKKTSGSFSYKGASKGGKSDKGSVNRIEGTSPVKNIKNRSFVQSLSIIEEVKNREELEELFNDIEEAGDIFLNVPIYSHLANYKSLLQKFMAKIIKDSYKVSSVTSQRIDKDDKVLTTVNTIDKKLEELSEELLNKQTDVLKLAAKVDDIKGLLMDLIF
jgi:uncharacterized protein